MIIYYRMKILEDKDEGVLLFPILPGGITCGETVEKVSVLCLSSFKK